MNSTPIFNLRAIARRIMKEHGFRTDFPQEALHQAEQVLEEPSNKSPIKDLTHLLWSSIDNDDSRDLDQLEYIQQEANGSRLFVAIADINWCVPPNSPVDQTAQQNTTSVYTGVEIFPMLPEKLSTDLTSLLEGKLRYAIIFEILFSKDGDSLQSTVYPALVQNKAQLTYEAVSIWLEKKNEPTDSAITSRMLTKIRANNDLQDQLRIQDQLAQTLEKKRHEAGALNFGTSELRPSISSTGEIHLNAHQANRATQLIENFMIAANQASVTFLESKKFPSIRRVVRTPKKWERIVELAKTAGFILSSQPDAKALQQFLAQQKKIAPDKFADLSLSVIKLLGRGEYIIEEPNQTPVGHFGLAVENYSHSTAPNRRYPDILTQRLILAAFKSEKIPYSMESLNSLAARCSEKETEANKVERSVHKSMAAVALSHHIGEIYNGIITGSSEKGVWVRISNPPIEGKLEGDVKKFDVGDRVTVILKATNPDRGFIDFEIKK